MPEATHLDGSPIADDEWCHGLDCAPEFGGRKHLHGKPVVFPGK